MRIGWNVSARRVVWTGVGESRQRGGPRQVQVGIACRPPASAGIGASAIVGAGGTTPMRRVAKAIARTSSGIDLSHRRPHRTTSALDKGDRGVDDRHRRMTGIRRSRRHVVMGVGCVERIARVPAGREQRVQEAAERPARPAGPVGRSSAAVFRARRRGRPRRAGRRSIGFRRPRRPPTRERRPRGRRS